MANKPRTPNEGWMVGALLWTWFLCRTLPYWPKGLWEVLEQLPQVLRHPFHFSFSLRHWPILVGGLGGYGSCWFAASAEALARRKKEEYGSAAWGKVAALARRYAGPPGQNKRLTQHLSLSLNTRKHGRNLNTLVIGGSGSGKTRSVCLPNLLEGACSYVVLDPKGEQLRRTGAYLQKKGYRVRVLNLIQMEQSHCYNPFRYLWTDNDVQKLVTNLFQAAEGPRKSSADPFWDTTAAMLLMAILLYIREELPSYQQNFHSVLRLLQGAMFEGDRSGSGTPLDRLFQQLEKEQPGHPSLGYYKSYRSGSGKTLKSIQVTLAAKLEKFYLASVDALTRTDELELDRLGFEKTALFAVIPDNDPSFNFLVSILYTQLFQQLFLAADGTEEGCLPIPVHFLMDEFANIRVPDHFDQVLSTMRSRGVFVTIVLQNLAQLKARFEREWESIVGNCDTLLYLGGNEWSTHKYLSELLGKQTISMKEKGSKKEKNGEGKEVTLGRELLSADEIRRLPNTQALLFIRGERPILDDKLDVDALRALSEADAMRGEERKESYPAIAQVKLEMIS